MKKLMPKEVREFAQDHPGRKWQDANPEPHIKFSFLLLFSNSVVSNSLWPHGLQHIRLSCPSLSPRDCSNSCPSSWWCHPTVSSSVARFSSYPQSFAGSGSFPVSQLFTSGDQSTGASASASVLPVNTESWFLLVLTDLISLLSKGLSESSPAPQFESIDSLMLSPLYAPTLTPYMTMEFHKFPNTCFYFFCRFFCVCFYHFGCYHSTESQGKINKC